MRVAIVSDIHGNRTAFEAVLADMEQTSPDLILHGGDLANGGASPAEIVDHIRDLGWPGVVGNTDELLFRPASLHEFAQHTPAMQPLVAVIDEIAAATREVLQSHFGAATLKPDPDEYLGKDFAALLETLGLASGMKLESENKNVPTGLEG